MQLTSAEMSNVVVFTLSGRLDAYTAPGLRRQLFAAIQQGHYRLVVNLGDVPLIDSAGLATLVAGMKHARQQQGDLRLAALQPGVRMIFEMTRLDRAFEILDSTESAVTSFN